MILLSVNNPIKVNGVGAVKASHLIWFEASARHVVEFNQINTIVLD